MSVLTVQPRREFTMSNAWFKKMCDMGLKFPDDYIVFDVETTGLDTENEYIVQFGHLIVENRVPLKPVGTILDWPRCPLVSPEHFYERLASVAYFFRGEAMLYRFDAQHIAAEGVDPIAVLQIYYDMFKDHQEQGGYFLTHNGVNYDSKVVSAHFRRFLGKDFEFNLHHMVDTGLLEKAVQLGIYPREDETILDFYRRVAAIKAKGVFWKLDNHCAAKYRLDERYALNMSGAHTADFDCLVTHLLMEEFRAKANGTAEDHDG